MTWYSDLKKKRLARSFVAEYLLPGMTRTARKGLRVYLWKIDYELLRETSISSISIVEVLELEGFNVETFPFLESIKISWR